ncbi:MAG TPA: response regulator, partial [Anaerolinea sp.]|nr:response regulator [Anaerolinea sp.]
DTPDRNKLLAAKMTEDEITGFLDVTGETNLKGMRIRVDELPILPILPDEGLVIADLMDSAIDQSSINTLDHCQVKAACFAPLRTGGRNIGALVASSRKITDFDPADVRLFRTVANGIAVAVEKQRLLRQAQRRALELQTASEIARDTTSTLALNILLSRMVQLMIERFQFYHASIFLVDEKAQYAVIRESSGSAGEELKRRGFRLAVGSRSVIGTVTASGLPLVINDVSTSDHYYPNPLLPDTRSEIGLPLKIGDRVIGALDIQSNLGNQFGKDDIYVLGILADQIAIAIENARAYEMSQMAIEDMKEVDRVKSQFLANMSHELRTPLNSIIGFSRVILKGIDGPVNDVQTQDLNAIYNSGQHLLSLINDILDLSKIEAGKMELSFTDLNLPDMINSAMSTASGLVKDKPIKLNIKVPDDLPIVRADAIRVRQVLINFLSNAAKFTDEGEITVEAARSTSPEGKPEVMVTVADSGPGIAPADQVKLFLPFSQVDDSPTRKTGGTGLGLSICRSLIELHGGRIGLLESTVGQGSTFFFTLPLPEVEVKPLELVPGDGSIILAIDDDPQVISLYERYLRPQGFQVVPHTDPLTAVEAATHLRPFAITLDIMMPEMDGWQVIKALKSNPATSEIPVIVCSILEDEEKGFNLGAADYLVKPFLSEDLLNALNRLNVDGEQINVMVVDDDEEDSRLVKKMIEQNKRFQAILADGGKTAWDLIQNQKPDAIILDLFMPEMNGFELLANLRKTSDLKDIPIIILTGADLTPEQHQILADSGQNLLSKGLLREKELLNSLEIALRQIRQPQGKAA